ncbi:23S rRNA (adenine(1618)-N(6))-methyltransferase RlmF [Shewanella profunda]|uniref:23S rRNA (adenine(1618)-N(6))-methyltransferase RlmF n=1 Tax=Shewanella profunda TaxID=254793 RepID=UPI00200F88E6|nr:23S rRNA (adenine(1618)-N(6))-methyltransferase RlmF [Shewanella profunda]MCL1090202.1 23S rRNA (adenine(1618)-N(6))-methyltransferase RlmF [Shewanella profunda]
MPKSAIKYPRSTKMPPRDIPSGKPKVRNPSPKVKAGTKAKTGPVKTRSIAEIKKALHPRNAHINGYDFNALIKAFHRLNAFVRQTPFGGLSIDFADPEAVKALNTALLKYHYGIDFWDIPKGALCPPIPGRVDYLHYLADLLVEGDSSLAMEHVSVLDIGTGANGIYPILGCQVYGWHFVASDINSHSLANVQRIVERNPALQGRLSLRLQVDEKSVFKGIIQPQERFELTLCNPPFHASLAEAAQGSQRKVRNLQLNSGRTVKAASKLNFGGQGAELWCKGGEQQFLATMINESQAFADQCLWFTSLVSKKENLKPCYQALAKLAVDTVKTIEMQQGNKITRVLAWSFHSAAKRQSWRTEHLNIQKQA